MTKLTFIQPDDQRITVDARIGLSVMQAALLGGVQGIYAECGGQLACATCHVFVQTADVAMAPASDAELSMLEYTVTPRRAASRLSCQIPVAEPLDGCVFEVAPEQL